MGAELDQTLVLSSPDRVPPFRLTPQAGFDAVENGDIWTTNAGVLAARLNGANRNMWHNGNLTSPSKEEAEQGTATIYRVWTAVNVATAIAAQLVKNLFSSGDKELPADDDVFTGVEADGVTGFKTTWENIKSALTSVFLPLSGGTVNGPVRATELSPSGGVGTNYIGGGTGDGASYSVYNMSIRTHYGIGMVTYNGEVNGFYNSRTGTWDVKGGYHVNGNPVALTDWITYVGLIADNPDAPYVRRRTDNSVVQIASRNWAQDQLNWRVTDGRSAGFISQELRTTGTSTTSAMGSSGYYATQFSKRNVELIDVGFRQPQIHIPNVGWRALGGW